MTYKQTHTCIRRHRHIIVLHHITTDNNNSRNTKDIEYGKNSEMMKI